MNSPALFIGVVSYTGSRFSDNQGPEGFAHALTRSLEAAGVAVETRINTENLHDPAKTPVTPALVQESLSAQLRLEDEWVRYLRGDDASTLSDVGRSGLRWGLRQWRRLKSPGSVPVTRLINIELSHVDLLQAGVSSGAPWLLIVEDDAATTAPADCASGLSALLTETPGSVQFVNLSESFPLSQLGVQHLLSDSGSTWAGGIPRQIVSASRPVTNTVCAILYRRDFAMDLLKWFAAQPMTPVVPIDWKLNKSLMELNRSGRLGAGTCWLISPAPIQQLSMRTGTHL